MAENEFFEPAEAEEILRRAVRTDNVQGKLSRDQLIESAAEMGIAPEAVALAIENLHQERGGQLEGAQREREWATWLQERRAKVLESVGGSLSIAVFLAGINFLTSGMKLSESFTWSKWPVGFFVVIALCEVIEYLFKRPTEAEFEKWRQKLGKKKRKANQEA